MTRAIPCHPPKYRRWRKILRAIANALRPWVHAAFWVGVLLCVAAA